MADIQHENLPFTLSEAEHKYGDKVHLVANPYLFSHLVQLC